jgi:hypothetical protein
METRGESTTALNRRRFVQSAAVAAVGVSGSLVWPRRAPASDDGDDGGRQRDAVPPQPIPGGIEIPDGPRIHVWAPGDPAVTLPFSGGTLMGFDVDPTTITDFRGFSAAAFHVGTATGGDGATYDLETDMRAFKGSYVDATGTRRTGAFAFI